MTAARGAPAEWAMSRPEADRLGWRFSILSDGSWRASKDVERFDSTGRSRRGELVFEGTMAQVLVLIQERSERE